MNNNKLKWFTKLPEKTSFKIVMELVKLWSTFDKPEYYTESKFIISNK